MTPTVPPAGDPAGGPGSDPGMGAERTTLAWQRTALSLAAGSAVVARLTFGTLGAAALAGMAVSLSLAVWVLVESRARYSPVRGVRRGGGRAPTFLALATFVLLLTELLAALR